MVSETASSGWIDERKWLQPHSAGMSQTIEPSRTRPGLGFAVALLALGAVGVFAAYWWRQGRPPIHEVRLPVTRLEGELDRYLLSKGW